MSQFLTFSKFNTFYNETLVIIACYQVVATLELISLGFFKLLWFVGQFLETSLLTFMAYFFTIFENRVFPYTFFKFSWIILIFFTRHKLNLSFILWSLNELS